MKVFIIAAVLIASTLAAPGVMDNKIDGTGTGSKIMQYFGNCVDSEDLTTCLTVKGISALERAARASNIKVAEGITLAREPSFNARSGKAISENEIVSSLPTEPEQRSARLYDLALDSITNFLSSHSLQLKFPTETTQEVSRAIDEGRGKLKKMLPKILPLLIGKKLLAVVPLFLVGLALLAFKALITAKIAFVLALFLTLSKAMSGGSSGGLGILGKVAGLSGGAGGLLGGLGGSGGSSGYANTGATASGYSQGNQGWSSGSGNSQYPYARSYDEAQDLAYQGQVQTE